MNQTVKEGYFDRAMRIEIGGETVQFRCVLPSKAKTWMALDMAEAGLVFDEELGLVYEAYTMECVLVFLMMKYYTDMDLSGFEGEEGWHQLHDLLESHDVLDTLYGYLAPDLEKVRSVFDKLKASAEKTFEHKHSLDYLVRKSFGSLLTTEDLMTTMAQAADINNTMVDLLDAFRQSKAPLNVRNNMLSFSKRADKDNPPV